MLILNHYSLHKEDHKDSVKDTLSIRLDTFFTEFCSKVGL